jgi:Regulator of chromosome condensation (RCC1) repeat
VLGVVCGIALALGAASAAQAAQGPLPLGVIGESISAGRSHTCAIKTDGTPTCWGDAGSGRLGAAPAFTSAPLPAVVGAAGLSLTARGLRALRRIASSVGQVARVECVGYTADLGRGDTRAARLLGRRRAIAACSELHRFGVRARYSVSTLGPRDPVADNDTAKGRDRNRRVTIEITHAR